MVKNLIENANVYCFTRLEALEAANTSTSSNAATDVDDSGDGDDEVDEAAGEKRTTCSGSSSSSSNGASAAKRAKADHCTWTGKLCDAKQHFNECEYAGEICEFGCGAVVRRMDMSEHKVSICLKREVPCSNVGCTAVMPGSYIDFHKRTKCLYELVDCPFSSVGCKKRMMRKDLDTHEDYAMKQHNRLLLKKVAKQEERLDKPLHQIVYKADLDDLLQDGKIDLSSDEIVVGAYEAYMIVDKGYDNNDNCCGAHLMLQDGPFPCRVISNFEVVHWDGKPESARKEECNGTLDKEELGNGIYQLIPMSELTAAASPYVKEGHVTFIVTFRLLPPEF